MLHLNKMLPSTTYICLTEKNLSLRKNFISLSVKCKNIYLTAFEPEYLKTMLKRHEQDTKIKQEEMILKAESEVVKKHEQSIFDSLTVNIKLEDQFRSTVGNLKRLYSIKD